MVFLRIGIINLFIVSALMVSSNTYAQDVSVQKLIEVEEQLREEQKQNEETKQAIAQLERKVQCVYSMVKGYEDCDNTYSDKSGDYFACIQQARENKENCMLEITAESQ